ncbi:hypothetical protein [Lysobacter gummosus]|uniref:hypothetical protein n=1 Tax=Lysobacter gummosus TaxID=262324 RepID=UPI003627BE91
MLVGHIQLNQVHAHDESPCRCRRTSKRRRRASWRSTRNEQSASAALRCRIFLGGTCAKRHRRLACASRADTRHIFDVSQRPARFRRTDDGPASSRGGHPRARRCVTTDQTS